MKKLLTRRKAQLYLIELVVAILLIASVILLLQTLQIDPNQASFQKRRELQELGWNALATSDELGLLRPAVYSQPVQDNSPEINALADFLNMALAPELGYKLDGNNQISGETWNIIGEEHGSELGEDRDIVVVNYLILGNPYSFSDRSVLNPVVVSLSLWYEL